ncbi:hypothetical protein M3I54_42160 [Paraburkholderia sp. CNPSo 3274]|uniref:hypothetical protein n=1 Tax=Paraburkholderia sp. CNPSo 3274 TaxID=2940932 RepID=UPI0020B6490C|nr:hypothetical protein [Paraburkholderia sp. CNPSo 3274]MCP3713384.1 hypothetical protein [Paraburkholderia sp. CNPSo 3274]
MTYAIALRGLAVLLALICIGLMSFVAHYTHAPRPQAPGPNFAVRPERAPRWPDATVRIGTVALLASFLVLTGACLLIAGV